MVIPEQLNLGIASSLNVIPRQYISPSNAQNLASPTTLGKLALGFHRTSRSFDEREREILNLIHPFVVHAYRNSQTYTRLQQQITQFSQAINELGSVILSPGGRIQFISPRALQLLSEYFPDSSWIGDQLPEALQTWVKAQIQQRYETSLSQPTKPLQIEQLGKGLSVRLLGSAASKQFTLTLEERKHPSFSVELLRSLGLTRRESEVLVWVAHGKTNAEIATVLLLSEKTVKKHLENMFKKLNVQTRAAAVTTVLELLGMMER
ncbi:response regulator transcription factor [Trichocoleus sp. FACHB-262]|uniref:response regulator transcription factor n=1 Tax=Trichocoleus sp. FACHB-262 TaxID=2692869 RepID=UPI001683A137|nr:helix-turn-helix transcriptional regulator [Trichocoleus sp. FACHB-262]MBD2123516.1 helix-turn-helix transcriptional regulator [Trichocoleus sp. FACHB-262]